jgi:succinate dehydrogenase hydrophobic anchor subunit
VLGSLLKALVGILIAFFAVFTFVYMVPLILRAMRTPGFETLSESIRESARDFGGSLGALVWAIFGLILAVFVIWTFAMFLPALFKAKIFQANQYGRWRL